MRSSKTELLKVVILKMSAVPGIAYISPAQFWEFAVQTVEILLIVGILCYSPSSAIYSDTVA